MGVLGLWQLLAPVGQPVSLESLENKIFAVDISIWLNQALKGYRDSEGGSVPSAHLMSLFTRLCKLMFYRIRPIIVFDGAAPELKKQTVINRQQRRDAMKQNSSHAGVKKLASYMVSQMLKAKNKNLKKGLTDIIFPRSKAPKDEIFLLPPLPVQSTADDCIKTEPELKFGMLTKDEMEYLSKIDIESEEFVSLPADIKLEILSTLKEHRRHRSWEEYQNLPDDSHDFSSYQLNCLLKRRNLQKKVEEVKTEMKKTSSADIIAMYDADDVVETSRIVSEDSAHYVFLKKAAKKSNDNPESIAGYSCVFSKGETAHAKTNETDTCVDSLDHSSDSDVDYADVISKSETIIPVSRSHTDDLFEEDLDSELSSCENNDSPSAAISESPKADSGDNLMGVSNKNKEILNEKCKTVKLEPSEEQPNCSHAENNDDLVSSRRVSSVQPQFSDIIDLKPCGSETCIEGFQNEILSDADVSFTEERKANSVSAGSVNSSQPEVPEIHTLSTIPPCEAPQPVPVDIYETNDMSTENDMSELICSPNADDVYDEACIAMQDELAASQAALAAQEAKQQRQANTVQEHMYEECQELLRLFGVPYIVSPTEAEAQCAYLDGENVTHGTITDDSDVWLFGGKRVYKNFFAQNKFVEFYKDSEIFSHFRLTRNKLINFALLTGSDYTEGIEGVGPVTAMEILSEFNADGIEALQAFKEWWDVSQKHSSPPKNKVKAKFLKLCLSAGFPSGKVFEAYLNPVVDTSTESFTWGRPDLDALRDYTKEKFGWNRNKVDDNLLPVIKRLNERTAQMHLDSYFTINLKKQENLFPSKRVMSALRKMHPAAKETSSKDDPEPQKKTVKTSRKNVATKIEKNRKRTKVSKGRRGKRQNLCDKVVPVTLCLSEESSNDSM